MKRKRKTVYPFVMLTIVHSLMLAYTLIKNKNRRTLVSVLFSNMGMAYLFEYLILNLFQAYRYKLKVFKKSYFNNFLGAILSQAIFIPFTALFISAFGLKWKWKAFFILYFHIIERAFIKMKIYKTYWWNPYFTSLLLPIYFFISDRWYGWLKEGSIIIKFISLWLANLITVTNLIFVLAVTRQIRFGRGRHHSLKEHFKIGPLYAIAHSLVSTWLVWRGGSRGLIKSFLLTAGTDWVLYKKKVVTKNFFIPGLNLFSQAFLCLNTAWFKKLVSRVEVKNEETTK